MSEWGRFGEARARVRYVGFGWCPVVCGGLCDDGGAAMSWGHLWCGGAVSGWAAMWGRLESGEVRFGVKGVGRTGPPRSRTAMGLARRAW